MSQGSVGHGWDPSPVSQAPGVIRLHLEGLLVNHIIFGAFEKDQMAQGLEIKGSIRVARKITSAATLLGEASF